MLEDHPVLLLVEEISRSRFEHVYYELVMEFEGQSSSSSLNDYLKPNKIENTVHEIASNVSLVIQSIPW